MLRINLLLYFLMVFFVGNANGQEDVTKNFLDRTGSVVLNEFKVCDTCSGGFKFKFKITRPDNKTGLIEVDSDMSIPREARFANGLYMLIGDLPYGGSVVFIIDEYFKIKSKFYSYDLVFSPDSNYVIFKQFFPRFLPVEFQKSIIRILHISAQSFSEDNSNPETLGSVIYPQVTIGKDKSLTNEGGDDINLINNVVWGKNWFSLVSKEDSWFKLNFSKFDNFKSFCSIPFLPLKAANGEHGYTHELTKYQNGKITVMFFENNGISAEFNFNAGLICDGILNK